MNEENSPEGDFGGLTPRQFWTCGALLLICILVLFGLFMYCGPEGCK